MQELLGLCDRLNLLLTSMPSARPSKLQLQGLGLNLSNLSLSDDDRISGNGSFSNENGNAPRSESPEQIEEDPSPTTPKVDKGKGKAEPEPEQHEPVLASPRHFLVGESEDEDDGQRFLDAEEGDESVTSPTDRCVSLSSIGSTTLLMTFICLCFVGPEVG
jgi:protein phosphatase 1 regulatory subunit 37